MKFNKIFVLCPKGIKTGGPELLHQLVYQINSLYGKDSAVIAYYGNLKLAPVKEYEKYIHNKYITFKDIEDQSNNVIIFPETAFSKLFDNYKRANKYIWWLSVDNYFLFNSIQFSLQNVGFLHTISRLVKGTLRDNIKRDRKKINGADLNLCQSFYAKDYLMKKEKICKLVYLSDYTNNFYIKNNKIHLFENRKNIVLYNPKKGYNFTKKIIEASKNKNWKWVALSGLSNVELQRYFETSKVYIDFGNHPGKDRLPREAAISGCCIITGKNGAASYYEDIPISNEYKFQNQKRNIHKIVDKIDKCVNNYNVKINDFRIYRDSIRNEESNFRKDIIKIFS